MPSSSKRKTDPSKQATQARQEQNENIGAPTPTGAGLETQDTTEFRQDELGRVDDYAERAHKIHPVKLSPPTNYGGFIFSKSPPNSTYNTTKSPLAEWTKNPPPFTSSSSNPYSSAITNLASSPPQAHHSRISGSPHHAYLSQSPPIDLSGRSFGHANSLPDSGGRFQQSPPSRNTYTGSRRASMLSQYGARPLTGQSPLPHEDQAHFYGTPQLDFGLPGHEAGAGKLVPGDKRYYCGFDRLDGAAEAASVGVENVLLCGYEGGLEVYNVLHDGAQLIGVLEGLRGSVIGAKILQWAGRTDPFAQQRPLVAIVMHGPIVDKSSADEQTGSDFPGGPVPHSDVSRGEEIASRIAAYQTSVEVYSLSNGRRVSTLYATPAVPVILPLDHPDFEPPPPSAEIVVEVSGQFVVVALGGRSGEIYVFSPAEAVSRAGKNPFRCLGKMWTATHAHSMQQSSAPSNPGFTLDGNFITARSVPIFSLSQRWLAVVPPPSSSQFSLYGTVSEQDETRNVPGLTISMSPVAPAITCGVDTPDDRFMSRMSRMAAKNLAKGAQWAGDYGKQLWRQYVSPSSPPLTDTSSAPPQYPPDQQHFPPTHAASDTPQTDHELNLIAIYDLNSLLQTMEKRLKTASAPIAVFEQPLGCSFLSFAPSGAHLLTVSKDGDTQILWDLKCMRHGRSTYPASRSNVLLGPHVREITRITRVTDANVVDIIWSPPKDEQFGVLTDKGTLHVHRLESALLQWPPLRRTTRSQAQAHGQGSLAHRSAHTSPEPPSPSHKPRLSFTYDAVNGATSWLSSIRGRSLSTGNGLPQIGSLSITPSAGAKGALVAATTASKAIGQGVHDFRHAADNKIYMHTTRPIGTRCAMWMTGGGRGLICVVVDGTLKLFKVRGASEQARGKSARGTKPVVVKSISQIPLQGLPNYRFPPALHGLLGQLPKTEDQLGEPPGGKQERARGMWQPRSPTASSGLHNDRRTRERTMWKSFAELETTSDYAKFHTDPRVSLFVYGQGSQGTSLSASGQEVQNSLFAPSSFAARAASDEGDVPWVFGGEIAVKKVHTGSAGATSAGMIAGEGDTEGFIWRNAREGGGEGEGIFEDDADVIDFV